jgi:hypothetical protein
MTRIELTRAAARSISRTLALGVALAPFATRALHAQSDGAIAAYYSLLATPAAALPPLAPATRGLAVHASFGHSSPDPSLTNNTFGIGVDMPLGSARVGVTAGLISINCDEGRIADPENTCAPNESHFMLAGNVHKTLWSSAVLRESASAPPRRRARAAASRASDLGTLSVGVDGQMGVAGLGDAGTAFTASVGLPVALTLGNSRVHVVPFLTPGIGYGSLSRYIVADDGTTSGAGGMRAMLGGGIGVMSAHSGLGASLGFQKIFIDGGSTQIGVGVTWQGLSAGR